MASSAPTGIYGGVPASERRADRRERLLDAGLDVLGTDGWQATTVRGSAQRAKLNPRYFYESFSGLDELLVAVFDRISAEALAAVVRAVEENPGDQEATARAAIGGFVALMTDDPAQGPGRSGRGDGLRGADAPPPRHPATGRRGGGRLRARTTQGRKADEQTIQLTAQMLVGGLIEALIAWFEGRLEVSRERLVEHCAALFVAAVGVSAER